MEGAIHLYEIPASERRSTDGRFIRLPRPTDGPFYPLSTLVLPKIRENKNAVFTAPYKSDDELREADIIHFVLTIAGIIIISYVNDSLPTMYIWNQILLTLGLVVVYSFVNKWALHYMSIILRFEWHIERPLWGKGGMENFGLAGFRRLFLLLKLVCWTGKGEDDDDDIELFGRPEGCRCLECRNARLEAGLGSRSDSSVCTDTSDEDYEDSEEKGEGGEELGEEEVRLLASGPRD
ncbi:hypothetical protein TWF481_011696 [Arthrobotrys musiformis]|uniref:Uncharacterized protein n=1 Tax=Arthrobotrys musiformis TaxID=47236 RepID=A0AAV9VZ09_9PEZI